MSESSGDKGRFEESMGQLEQLVRDLEQGQLGLEQALAHYEQGVALIRRCHGQLQEAELRISVLTGVDDAGEVRVQPFAHEATENQSLASSEVDSRRKPKKDRR